jgi:uncharacterized protein YggE
MKTAISVRNSACGLIAAAIFSSALLHAQIGPTTTSSVTVTATQPGTAQPAEASFLVTVNTPFGTSLSDAAASVTSAGITVGNLVGVTSTTVPSTTTGQPSSSLTWTFQLITPFANQKATAATLAGIQSKMSQSGGGFSLSFTVSSYGTSTPSCSLSGLVADARTQAQALASAAGVGLGSIIGISSTVSSTSGPPCSMTVKFALGFQFWQLQPAITINASQTAGPNLDQAVVEIAVGTLLGAGLDDVTSALQTAGIAGTTLSGINTVTSYFSDNHQVPQYTVYWQFQLTTPLSNISAVLAQLTTAQQAFQRQNVNFNLTLAVVGASSSQPVSCPETALLALAQTQAQQVAAAAGMHAGAVLNLTSNSVGQASASGGFAAGFLSYGLAAASPTVSNFCTMNAQFQLQ